MSAVLGWTVALDGGGDSDLISSAFGCASGALQILFAVTFGPELIYFYHIE